MKIDPAFVTGHFAYSRWATQKTLGACSALTPDELNRQLFNSFGGVLGTLHHIFYADRVWLSRVAGGSRTTLADGREAYGLAALGEVWQKVFDEYDAWAAKLTAPDLDSILEYRDLSGKARSLPLWQVVLHIVNHATYHRGQITTMLRQLAHAPVSTDLLYFFYEQQQKQNTPG